MAAGAPQRIGLENQACDKHQGALGAELNVCRKTKAWVRHQRDEEAKEHATTDEPTTMPNEGEWEFTAAVGAWPEAWRASSGHFGSHLEMLGRLT